MCLSPANAKRQAKSQIPKVRPFITTNAARRPAMAAAVKNKTRSSDKACFLFILLRIFYFYSTVSICFSLFMRPQRAVTFTSPYAFIMTVATPAIALTAPGPMKLPPVISKATFLSKL